MRVSGSWTRRRLDIVTAEFELATSTVYLINFQQGRPHTDTHSPSDGNGEHIMSTYTEEESDSLLDKIDKAAPASLNQFDAFPKLPSTYKARTGGGGLLTVVVALVSFLLIVNDIGEWIWGWPHYSFDVDPNKGSFMDVNVDVLVNMPCGCE